LLITFQPFFGVQNSLRKRVQAHIFMILNDTAYGGQFLLFKGNLI
jgi:hypothetical protein